MSKNRDSFESIAIGSLPLMTVERFAELIGLPIGVCEAQADRRLWPIIVVGKRRFINVELVRKQALEAEFKK